MDHLSANRRRWSAWAQDYVDAGERLWAADTPTWGIWSVPDEDVHLLTDRSGNSRVSGRDVVELGCGTGYVSAWVARAGGRPVGIDPTRAQLDTARRLQGEHDLRFPLVEAAGERLPFPDDSFDVAISEYGAALWADPYVWVPEAARVLRPGGVLGFLTCSPLVAMCAPDAVGEDAMAGTTLLRPQFGLHRIEWESDGSIEFNLGHGAWFRLLCDSGFSVDELIEVQAPAAATTRYEYVDARWAHRWPSEDIWIARLR